MLKLSADNYTDLLSFSYWREVCFIWLCKPVPVISSRSQDKNRSYPEAVTLFCDLISVLRHLGFMYFRSIQVERKLLRSFKNFALHFCFLSFPKSSRLVIIYERLVLLWALQTYTLCVQTVDPVLVEHLVPIKSAVFGTPGFRVLCLKSWWHIFGAFQDCVSDFLFIIFSLFIEPELIL